MPTVLGELFVRVVRARAEPQVGERRQPLNGEHAGGADPCQQPTRRDRPPTLAKRQPGRSARLAREKKDQRADRRECRDLHVPGQTLHDQRADCPDELPQATGAAGRRGVRVADGVDVQPPQDPRRPRGGMLHGQVRPMGQHESAERERNAAEQGGSSIEPQRAQQTVHAPECQAVMRP